MNGKLLKARLILEKCLNDRLFANIFLNDGAVMVFMPSSLSPRFDSCGEVIWIAVGIAINLITNEESFAVVRLEFVEHVEIMGRL